MIMQSNEIDILYIETWSFVFDILFNTYIIYF